MHILPNSTYFCNIVASRNLVFGNIAQLKYYKFSHHNGSALDDTYRISNEASDEDINEDIDETKISFIKSLFSPFSQK